MRLTRIPLATLLAAVVVCAVAFAALRSPSPLWASALFTTALGALAVALLNVLLPPEPNRAFWAGFLILGGLYLGAASSPLRPSLITSCGIYLLYWSIGPSPDPDLAPPPAPIRVVSLANGETNSVRERELLGTWRGLSQPDNGPEVLALNDIAIYTCSEAYRQIGHSLVTLIVGFAGGLYAARSAQRERPQPSTYHSPMERTGDGGEGS